ncbi:MAG TPA: hypothetical protein VFZ48_04315 [Candidatus Saccharimonadales bacterium]
MSLYHPDDSEMRRYATGQYIEWVGAIALLVLFGAGMVPVSMTLAEDFNAAQVFVSFFAGVGIFVSAGVLVRLMMKGLEASRQERIKEARSQGRIVELPCTLVQVLQDDVRAASCTDACLFGLAKWASEAAKDRPADVSAWSQDDQSVFYGTMMDHHESMDCPASTR